jgi:purine-nucleoside phosphorylase
VIVGVHSDLKILGLGVLTDVCLADALRPCCIEEIIAVANLSGPLMEKILFDFLARAGEKGML